MKRYCARAVIYYSAFIVTFYCTTSFPEHACDNILVAFRSGDQIRYHVTLCLVGPVGMSVGSTP